MSDIPENDQPEEAAPTFSWVERSPEFKNLIVAMVKAQRAMKGAKKYANPCTRGHNELATKPRPRHDSGP